MSFVHRITSEDIRRIDSGDMAGHIARMGEHIREAIGFSNVGLKGTSLPQNVRSVVVLGMGGSAIGADLVRSYLSNKLPVPIVVNRSYDLPSFVDSNTLVIASSYSGNTEETLSAFEQAIEKKLAIVCITTGGKLAERAKQLGLPVISQRAGMQPRAALAFSFVPVLLTLEKLGLTSNENQNVEKLAAFLDSLAEQYGTAHLEDTNTAFHLAGDLMHRIPVFYSSQELEAISLRWRGQLQENAKHIAFGNVLPEMNHNEINGWGHPIDLVQHFSVALLRSQADDHARVAKRFSALKEILGTKQVPVTELFAEGETRLERIFSLIALADWTSLYMGLFAGTDPTPIPTIDLLKQKMS